MSSYFPGDSERDAIALAAWEALTRAATEAWALLPFLDVRDGERTAGKRWHTIRHLGAELSNDLISVTAHTPASLHNSKIIPSPREWSRIDFAKAANVFKSIRSVLINVQCMGSQYPLDYELHAQVRATVAAVGDCKESLVAYAHQVKRQKALERLGLGRNR